MLFAKAQLLHKENDVEYLLKGLVAELDAISKATVADAVSVHSAEAIKNLKEVLSSKEIKEYLKILNKDIIKDTEVQALQDASKASFHKDVAEIKAHKASTLKELDDLTKKLAAAKKQLVAAKKKKQPYAEVNLGTVPSPNYPESLEADIKQYTNRIKLLKNPPNIKLKNSPKGKQPTTIKRLEADLKRSEELLSKLTPLGAYLYLNEGRMKDAYVKLIESLDELSSSVETYPERTSFTPRGEEYTKELNHLQSKIKQLKSEKSKYTPKQFKSAMEALETKLSSIKSKLKKEPKTISKSQASHKKRQAEAAKEAHKTKVKVEGMVDVINARLKEIESAIDTVNSELKELIKNKSTHEPKEFSTLREQFQNKLKGLGKSKSGLVTEMKRLKSKLTSPTQQVEKPNMTISDRISPISIAKIKKIITTLHSDLKTAMAQAREFEILRHNIKDAKQYFADRRETRSTKLTSKDTHKREAVDGRYLTLIKEVGDRLEVFKKIQLEGSDKQMLHGITLGVKKLLGTQPEVVLTVLNAGKDLYNYDLFGKPPKLVKRAAPHQAEHTGYEELEERITKINKYINTTSFGEPTLSFINTIAARKLKIVNPKGMKTKPKTITDGLTKVRGKVLDKIKLNKKYKGIFPASLLASIDALTKEQKRDLKRLNLLLGVKPKLEMLEGELPRPKRGGDTPDKYEGKPVDPGLGTVDSAFEVVLDKDTTLEYNNIIDIVNNYPLMINAMIKTLKEEQQKIRNDALDKLKEEITTMQGDLDSSRQFIDSIVSVTEEVVEAMKLLSELYESDKGEYSDKLQEYKDKEPSLSFVFDIYTDNLALEEELKELTLSLRSFKRAVNKERRK